MRIAMLSPIGWRTPPRHYGPRERLVSELTEGLVARGVDVTLFATADSETRAKLRAVVPRPYEENKDIEPKAWEALHISEVVEQANDFDLIHNHLDFSPLTYSNLVKRPTLTTVHDFSVRRMLPGYKKYARRSYYVSISFAVRSSELEYVANIYPGIDVQSFTFSETGGEYLLYCGRIQADKGTREAIEIARLAEIDLLIAGIVNDEQYFEAEIEPNLDGSHVRYVGSVGPDETQRLLGQAKALLRPVRLEEPFDLSTVEANACGTPVVVFAQGSKLEIITDGLNGFLVSDVPEAVEAVKKIHTISRADCRKVAEERFSRDRMVDEYYNVYSRILEATKTEGRRPWGYYEVLSDFADHKVKRIVVWPGRRLSLQRHRSRSEHWTVIGGTPVVTVEGREITLKPGDSTHIPVGAEHRLSNPGADDVVLIEVQTGNYFGEDDIERSEDDFGRL